MRNATIHADRVSEERRVPRGRVDLGRRGGFSEERYPMLFLEMKISPTAPLSKPRIRKGPQTPMNESHPAGFGMIRAATAKMYGFLSD